MCDTVYPVCLVLPNTPIHFLNLWLFSVLIAGFFLQPFRSCTIYLSFLLSSTFLQLSVLTQLYTFSAPQYTQCRFIVRGFYLLPPGLLCVVGWVRLLTLLVVICIFVVLVWRLKDAESTPQFELKLLSDLRYSEFTLIIPCSPHMLLACVVQL